MTEKIFTQIGDERIELTGQALEDFIADREEMRQAAEAKRLETEAKAQAKAELLERLGITEDEAKLLLA
jgi:hypothetical protein